MSARQPLYPRLLRLRHIHPNGWQRAVLGEGALAVAALLVLADLATAWTLLVLPLTVAGIVKAHDLLAGLLAGRVAVALSPDPAEQTAGPEPADRTGDAPGQAQSNQAQTKAQSAQA